jgi:hypothetical protein
MKELDENTAAQITGGEVTAGCVAYLGVSGAVVFIVAAASGPAGWFTAPFTAGFLLRKSPC